MAGGDRDPETWEARKLVVVKSLRRDLRGELDLYHGDSDHHGGNQKIKWAETAEGHRQGLHRPLCPSAHSLDLGVVSRKILVNATALHIKMPCPMFYEELKITCVAGTGGSGFP